MKPLLKWPGSKSRIADDIANRIAPCLTEKGRYVELFAGSASVLFHLNPKRSVIVDSCKPLISFYEAIKREPDAVYNELTSLMDLPVSEESYYHIRSQWNGNDFGVKFAAQFIYLNKMCFNGLFRMSSDLKFNVSWGQKDKMPYFPELDEIRNVSNVLRNAKLYCRDYSVILRATRKGDVVYADPPYWGKYDRYSGAGSSFSEKEQRRLANMLKRAAQRGVTVFASNVDCDEVRSLYEWADIDYIPVRHKISASSEGRKDVNEIIASSIGPWENKNQMSLFDYV